MIKTNDLLNLEHTAARDYFSNHEYPWEILSSLEDIVLCLIEKLDKSEFIAQSSDVFIHKSVKVFPGAYIYGPTIIYANSEIRPGAFIRGNVLIGENCVIGNSSEIKNSIIFDNVEVPHLNYVGDSILGFKSHMGAGSVASNEKSDKTNVIVKCHCGKNFDTNLNKLGVVLGDYAEVGCNSVLNPGTIIGRNSIIYPLSNVRGVIPSNSIYKDKENIVARDMRY